jgi:hypothetical protein
MESLIIGALGSLIASLVIVFFMYHQRPKMVISDKIAKTSYGEDTIYSIKVVNIGSRDAVSIKTELLIMEPQVVEGGVTYNILEIPLIRNEIFQIRPLSTSGDRPTGVFEFITNVDIEAEWENRSNSYLLFRLIAQDSLSGFSQVFRAEYYSKNAIISGRFGTGRNMNIST